MTIPLPPVSQPNHRPAMVRSATEHEIKLGARNRRSMAVGPLEDLPPHIRQHVMRQHASLMARHQEEERLRHINLEAQREFLIRRGFPPTHPYISGEVMVHPELQGQLPFATGNMAGNQRTIPLRPEDYNR